MRFYEACKDGHPETITKIVSLEPDRRKINIHASNDTAFQLACGNGHIPVIDRLFSLEPTHGKIDIHAEDDRAFRYTCGNGHIPVMEKLLSLESSRGKLDIHAREDSAFRYACRNGHIPVVARLLSLQRSHGKIAPERLELYVEDVDLSKHLEAAFSFHTFQEVQICLADLALITTVPQVKSTIRRISASKAKARLIERDIASPALRP